MLASLTAHNYSKQPFSSLILSCHIYSNMFKSANTDPHCQRFTCNKYKYIRSNFSALRCGDCGGLWGVFQSSLSNFGEQM